MHDSDVPHEIWTEIFQYLPHCTLLQVHLSQKRFRAISLPFLFREFDLDYRRAIYESDFTSRRLQFWISSEIAPFVHLCRVREGIGLHKPWPVLNEFFDSFHHFTNLRRLTIVHVDYNPAFLRTLRLLPNLTHLEVMFSQLGKPAIDSDLETLPLEISGFTYFGRSLQHWFPFLRRTKLRHFSTRPDAWLITQLLSGDPFPYVTHLEFQMDEVFTLFANLRVLAKFPATEVLTIRARWTTQGFDGSGRDRTPLFHVLTSLKQYQGPDYLLDVLLPIPSLHRLILPIMGAPKKQLARIRAINVPLNHITSLDIGFFDFDHENLCDLCGLFPHLTNLRIEVGKTSWEVYDFFENLAGDLPFPACLQKFAIHWDYIDENTHLEFGAPVLPNLKDVFVSKYPYMKAIWVDGSSGFLYYWKLGEAAVQYYGYYEGEGYYEDYWEGAGKLRGQLKALWDTI
ncbi:hypothetical protein B0H12DRAFT_327111 [Mycena haematopus]|nr:hypothetical protein B0H12DRAFT_327111 [Mycena haematopus]